jgi:hypothetical protein
MLIPIIICVVVIISIVLGLYFGGVLGGGGDTYVMYTMSSGQFLESGGMMWSKNNNYVLYLNPSGNLLLYKAEADWFSKYKSRKTIPFRNPIWSTDTKITNKHAYLRIVDGNLVIHDGHDGDFGDGTWGPIIWSSETNLEEGLVTISNEGQVLMGDQCVINCE